MCIRNGNNLQLASNFKNMKKKYKRTITIFWSKLSEYKVDFLMNRLSDVINTEYRKASLKGEFDWKENIKAVLKQGPDTEQGIRKLSTRFLRSSLNSSYNEYPLILSPVQL